MPVYHQMGHQSDNLTMEPSLSAFRGAILSPVNYSKEQMTMQVNSLQRLNNFRLILDPQLYYPKTERIKLKDWFYFPKDVDTADMSSESWWSEIIDKMLPICLELGVDAVCSPAVIARSYTDEYFDLMTRVGNMLTDSLLGSGIAPILTAIVGISELGVANKAYSIASILTRTKAHEIYLVLIGDTEPRRELADPEEIKGIMRLISSIEDSGIKVIVGFTSSDIVLWKSAGATACASGKFFNLRRFTSSRFEEPSGGGGQLSYWFEEAFMAYLRESDLIRVQSTNLISASSQRNPFCAAITKQMERDPGTAWVSLGWRQYLYWFAEIENRINTQQASIATILRDAENNWIKLEDQNIFMEERRNNGEWLRAWRRALAEFDRA